MSLLCVDYIATFLPIATFCLSVAIVVVAWQQWRVARNKLRLDLFDRRWQIYTATSKFVKAINNDPEHQVDPYLNDFNAGTSNAEFLFDSNVVNYIKELRSHASAMQAAHRLSESERVASERKWLSEQVKNGAMTKTFAPYLGFANIKA